jgi:hypothetical protein
MQDAENAAFQFPLVFGKLLFHVILSANALGAEKRKRLIIPNGFMS